MFVIAAAYVHAGIYVCVAHAYMRGVYSWANVSKSVQHSRALFHGFKHLLLVFGMSTANMLQSSKGQQLYTA